MESLTGSLVVAAPDLMDPNFHRSVVLIVRHDDEGALGLVLNRPTRTLIKEAWEHLSEVPCARAEVLRHGGPCDGPLMMLHAEESLAQLQVCEDVFFTIDPEHAERLVTDVALPARMFVGHSGWAPGQLESELTTGSWLTLRAARAHVFDDLVGAWEPVKRECDRATLARCIDPRLIPRDPSSN